MRSLYKSIPLLLPFWDMNQLGLKRSKDLVVEILNPDHYIANLSRDSKLSMEMVVRTGRGYIPAERNKEENQPIGTIPIDAIFSPIKKVNYTITNARVGQITDYDKLTLELWTDGSLNPEEAVAHVAKILKDQLSIFVTFEEEEEETATSGDQGVAVSATPFLNSIPSHPRTPSKWHEA